MAEYSENLKRKITEYFKDKWRLHDYKNGWVKGKCPECDKYKFGVNISKNHANCFSCGTKPSLLQYIVQLEQLKNFRDVHTLLNTFKGTNYLEVESVEKREISDVRLPQSFKLLTLGNSILSSAARSYMENRGFDSIELSMMGIGYCTRGEYAGIIILPFYQNNILTYFIGRRFVQIGGEKFKNPSVEDFGIGKSMITYNVDALQIYSKIYLVESVINALTLGENAVAILGKKISNYQKSMLIRSPVKEIVLCLDQDAMDETIKLAKELSNFKKVKIINFPYKQDVNDVGRKWVKEVEKREKYFMPFVYA